MRGRHAGWLAAILVGAGCYDLRGGSAPQVDAARSDDHASEVAVIIDAPPAIVDRPVGGPDARDGDDDTPDVGLDAASDLGMDAPEAAADAGMDVASMDGGPATVDVVRDAVEVEVDGGPPPCPAGETRCGDTCVDTSSSLVHCGMCGAACPMRAGATAACVGGSCRFTCNAGLADCDSDATNGCETDLANPVSCGACGTRCLEPTPLCQERGVQRECVSGCSGASGTRCAMSCVDTQSDLQHCGACGRACQVPMNGRATCASGACRFVCNVGFHACGSNCVDDTSVASCGALCTPCPTRANATPTCTAGSCGFTCSMGFANCDGDASNGCEVDTRTSPDHCSGCGRTCPSISNASNTCSNGVCAWTCQTGFGNCDGNAANGCETQTRTNDSHCGACGVVCGVGTTCRSGRCGPIQRSCDGAAEGCGTVHVVGGTFEMGGRTACEVSPSDPACVGAAPVRADVTVSSFRIDAYEVTVGRFRQFWAQRSADLNSIRARPIAYPGGETIAWTTPATTPDAQSSACNWSPTDATRLAHPMNCIDWWMAQEFCVWDGGRLPTEAEWEYAARGRTDPGLTRVRLYPWGDQAPSRTCDRAQWGNECTGDDGGGTRRVGSFAATAGIFDLAGNVQEWTADRLVRNYQGLCPEGPVSDPLCGDVGVPNFVVRGGDYVSPMYLLRSATRNDGNPTQRFNAVGFRCARRAPSPRQLSPLSTATTTSRTPTLKIDLGGWPAARVDLCRDRACSSIEDSVMAVGRQARPSVALAPGVHFWRVVGQDGGETSRPSPTWEFFVGSRSAPIDTSWGSIADFNGDGRPDLAVSAPGVQANTGRVYVYGGTSSGLGATPTVTLIGPDGAGGRFGNGLTSVVSGGDVNGDGFADLVVGTDPVGSLSGRLYVFNGGPSGIGTTPSSVINGPDGAGSGFGTVIAAALDFNGDGFADLVASSPRVVSETGRVHLYLGSPQGLSPVPAGSYSHPAGPANLLGVATAAGDFNGDGLGDVVVGAFNTNTNRGEARLFLGNSSASMSSPTSTISNPLEGVFGGSMACAGDVNGDGRADIIVGAYGYHAHVYLGSSAGLASSSSVTFATPLPLEASFGGSVAGVGDVNGDGYGDVTVRAHLADSGAGRSFVYYGSASGPQSTPSLTIVGVDGSNAYFGYSMAGAADFDLDGYSDVPISAYGSQSGVGRVYIFPGSSTGLRTVPSLVLIGPDGVGGNFGVSVARLLAPRGRRSRTSWQLDHVLANL